MEVFEATKDNQILNFKFNEAKDLSTLSFNSVDQQHSPLAYDTIESTPASGNYFRTPAKKTFLGPAPRSQLGVPTKQVYKGNRSKFYKPILNNANFVRGNQFGVVYPYKKARKYYETVAIPSVTPDKNGPVDYLGNDAKIVMRNNDPFYPYPSQHLLENKNYWSYMHPRKYLSDQPIYNYPHGKMEGSSRGRYKGGMGYDPYDPMDGVENFCGCNFRNNEYEVVENFGDCSACKPSSCPIGRILAIIVIMIILILCYYYMKK